MLEESLNAADTDIANKTSAAISNNLESINQLSPPTPFNYAQFQAATDNIPDNKTDFINQLSPPTPFHPYNVPDTKILADREVTINQLSPPVPFNYAQFQAATDNIPDDKSDLINQLAPPTPFHPHDVPDNKVLDINQLSPPVPFNFTDFERDDDDDDDIKMNAKELMNQMPVAVSNDNDSSHVEPIQNVGSNHFPNTSEQSEIDPPPQPPVSGNHNQVPDIIRRPPPPSMLLDPFRVSDPSNITSESVLETATVENATAQGVVDASVENNETSILEAYAVDDDIYGATPLEPILPWWKQRRTKILLGVVLVIVSTLAIVIGVELSNDDGPVTVVNNVTNVIVNVTDSPSISLAPSTSSAPSSSPTECVNKIISNSQEIDLVGDDPKVAVDGRNMIVASLVGRYYNTSQKLGVTYSDGYEGPVFVTFYSSDEIDDKWRRVQSPLRVDGISSLYSVAISDTTALLGLAYANNDKVETVIMYEQDRFGDWVRVDEFGQTLQCSFFQLTSATCSFGYSVDIDRDLACLTAWNGIFLYHRDEKSKWVQFDTIEMDLSHPGSVPLQKIPLP